MHRLIKHSFIFALICHTYAYSMINYPYKTVDLPHLKTDTKSCLDINEYSCLFGKDNTLCLHELATGKNKIVTFKKNILSAFLTKKGPLVLLSTNKFDKAYSFNLDNYTMTEINNKKPDTYTTINSTSLSGTMHALTVIDKNNRVKTLICNEKGTVITSIVHKEKTDVLNFSGDGTKLLRGNWDTTEQRSRVTLYNAKGQKLRSILMGLWKTKNVFFSPQETFICNGYYAYNIKTNQFHRMSAEQERQAIQFTSDEKYYLLEGHNNSEFSYHLFTGPHIPQFFKVPYGKQGHGYFLNNKETALFLTDKNQKSAALHFFKNPKFLRKN